MFDLIREIFCGPVEMLPRAGASRLDEAVAFVGRIVEEERRGNAPAAGASGTRWSRTGGGEDDGLVRYSTDLGLGTRRDFSRPHVRPDLRAAILSFPARLIVSVREKCGGDGRVAYSRSHVSRQIYSRIVSWDDGRADKRTVMKFCLGLKMDLAEAELLMKSAGYAFSGTIPLDCAVVYAIEHGIWNIDDVNEILVRSSLPPLD